MKALLLKKRWFLGLALVLIGTVILMSFGVLSHEKPELVTAVVDEGPVRQLVSVSGVAEAEDIADLAFPVSGIARTVAVRKGDQVTAGDVLVTLETANLEADRRDALAQLSSARADRDELIAGLTSTDRQVQTEKVELKETALQKTREDQARAVANTRRALLSGGLSAVSDDPDEDAVPPTVSGTYTCDEEGRYTISVYSSNTSSGYSFRLSGLESGTFPASTDQPILFGNCGLRLQFDADSIYGRTEWYVDVPNQKSSVYVNNRNAYELAKTNAETAISLAEQELALAEADSISATAPARSEAIVRANSAISRAEARLAGINADIDDRTLKAPFDGIITEVDILPGETVTTAPIVTLLADSRFELTARIPEIDIGKLELGQKALVTFDTRDNEVINAEIDYISPQATEIDGVAYYEARLVMLTQPPWMRSGLNADIDIVINETTNALRLPKRFVSGENGNYSVQTVAGNVIATTTVEVVLIGNDGFVAITGLNKGDQVIAE